MKKGKIKFSTLKNNRGVKIDGFRIAEDLKDKAGDWQLKTEFPKMMNELDFYFPFNKMENNISISYSGYCNLPKNGANSAEGSYFVVSDGIGCPLVAMPNGHNGKCYGAKGETNLILTEERLKKWSMVKKRMAVHLTPINWAPHEYLVWHTTSTIAIDSFIQEYMNISDMIQNDLSLIPLSFKAVGKSGKSKTGVSYRFFHGSISTSKGLLQLKKDVEDAIQLRKFFDINEIEKQFEQRSYFYEDDASSSNNGEEVAHDEKTGEIIQDASKAINYKDLLLPFVNEAQAKRIITLATEADCTDKIVKLTSTTHALSLLNKLQSNKNNELAA